MADEILTAFNQSANEAEYQEQLKSLVEQGRNTARTVKAARPGLHDRVEELAKQGIVQDSFREHAVLDFDLDGYEESATILKQRAQKTLLIRQVIYPQQQVSDERRSSQLQHLENAGIL